MGGNYDPAEPVTREELALFAQRLRTFAAMVDGNVRTMEEAGIDAIDARQKKSRTLVIAKLSSCVPEIEKGLIRKTMGIHDKEKAPESSEKPIAKNRRAKKLEK